VISATIGNEVSVIDRSFHIIMLTMLAGGQEQVNSIPVVLLRFYAEGLLRSRWYLSNLSQGEQE